MEDTSVKSYWVNPFQMHRYNGKDVREDDERENGDNSIIHTYSPRSPTPGSYNKKSSPPPTRTRRHSFTPDEKPPKGINYTMPLPPPTKVRSPADAAAVLASVNSLINHDKKFYQQHPHKYTVDEKPKKQLKRSISFNHSNRPISPRQTASIDVAEVLATTVSFVRENNKKLDRLSDEVRSASDGQSSDNDMDSVMSDDSMDSYQNSSSNREIENEIALLGDKLNDMEQKYKDQIRGKNSLIETLENKIEHTVRRSEKDARKRRQEIERLENKLKASNATIELLESKLENSTLAIAELLQQENFSTRSVSPDPETQRLLVQELEEKDKQIDDLNNKLQVLNKRSNEFKDKEKKLESVSNQLLKYQSLENEWKEKQVEIDSLTNQLQDLKKREIELGEKGALIETLNMRLDTSQKVIAELREKHAPHDLLRQIRQKDYIIDNLTQQVENIDAYMKDRDDDISALTSNLAEEKRLVEKLKDQISQIDPLKRKVEEVEDANYDIRTQLSHKERQFAELERKYKEATRLSQDSQDKIKAQDQNISSLHQEITQYRQTFSAQASESREKERLLSTLRDETAHMRSNYQGLINALSEKDQKIQQFERHLESLQNAQAAQNVAKNDSNESDIKANKSEVRLNALQKVLNTKIEVCRDYEKKITNLEKEFDGLKKQIEETQTASSEKEVKIARLVKMNRQLKEEVVDLKQKMEEKEKELVIIKSKIPQPNPGKAPAASVRSAPTKSPRSRVSSMYSISGGESSSDEAAKKGGPRIRKAASLSGIDTSPLKSITTTSYTSRRISESPRVALARTKSSTSTSSIEERSINIIVSPSKRDTKTRVSSSAKTVDVLKKNITPKKESSPINRSAVTQRKRDMEVKKHIISGVTPDRNRLLAQKRSTTVNQVTKKKSTDITSSDSEHDIKKTTSKKRSSVLSTITEKTPKSNDSTEKPKVARPKVDTKASTSAPKTRTSSMIRPLPSKK